MDERNPETQLTEILNTLNKQFGKAVERNPENKRFTAIKAGLEGALSIPGSFKGSKKKAVSDVILQLQDVAQEFLTSANHKAREGGLVLNSQIREVSTLLHPVAPPPNYARLKDKSDPLAAFAKLPEA
jgi:hypothetical protein